MFVTIEPSPSHGKLLDWETYNWGEYNDRYYEKLLYQWDSGQAIRSIIDPVPDVTVDDLWIADSIKCPPSIGEDDQKRPKEFEHCRTYFSRELETIDPEIVVALGNKPATRTLDVLDGPNIRMGTASYAGRRFDTDPPLLISTSWPHGWLFDRSPARYWGGDWVDSQPELQDTAWDSYLDIVQTSLKEALTGE